MRQAGFVGGLDDQLSPNWRVGASLSYATPDVTEDVTGNALGQRSTQANAYGRFTSGNWHVDSIVGFAVNQMSTKRNIRMVGLARSAEASFSGTSTQAYFEGGHTFGMADTSIEPLLALSYVRGRTNGFTESGAGAVNLIVAPRVETSLRSTVGARVAQRFDLGRTSWIGNIRVARTHEFRDPIAVQAQFSGDVTGTVFQSAGTSVPRNSFVWGTGLSAQATKTISLYIDYAAEISAKVNAKFISAGARIVW